MRNYLATLLGNLALVAIVCGALMLATSGIDLALWRDGRFTDLACYLFLAALAVATVAVGRLDYLASRGRIPADRLPRWLQDANDPR